MRNSRRGWLALVCGMVVSIAASAAAIDAANMTNFRSVGIESSRVHTAPNVAAAITELQTHPPHLVIAMATAEFPKTVIPAVESVLLAEYLRSKRTPVRLLLTPLITHAEVDRAAAAADVWNLVRFWADVLGR